MLVLASHYNCPVTLGFSLKYKTDKVVIYAVVISNLTSEHLITQNGVDIPFRPTNKNIFLTGGEKIFSYFR